MRIILADQNQKTLWALITVLHEEPEMNVVGEAKDAEGLRMVAKNTAADLILLDKKLAGGRAESLISELHALEPRPTVVVMSSHSEDSRLMLKAGADSFVSKGDRPDWLLETLRHYASRAQQYVEPK